MTQPIPDTAGAPWGAASTDWQHWAERLGLAADLLPVVSRPGAAISAQSKMRDLGKTPSRYNGQREVVGFPAWTAHQASDREIGRWSRDSDLGICVQTRRVRAIDVDIADGPAAQAVLELIEMAVGALPRRSRPNSGKFLLLFDMPGEFTKRIIRTAHGAIEFLATGQQFIAVGTHPSGVRYEWDADMGNPISVPALTPAEFEVLWQGLASTFGLESIETRAGMVPTQPRRRDDAIGDHVVDFLRENGWIKEWERDGRVHVRCPWEHEHTSDSGPSSTTWFPAGVGGFEQGHFRCLHAHCAGRTDGDFLNAIGYNDADFDVVAVQGSEPDAGGAPGEPPPWPVFTRDSKGRIESTALNVRKALERPDVCGARIAYDEFKDATLVAYLDLQAAHPQDGDGTAWRPLRDTDYFRLREALEQRGFKSPGTELVREAVARVAEAHAFDSAIQWGESLRHDGKARAETFFIDHFGVPDTPYARAVGLYTWTALAGRLLVPGIKADMVPVLISGQGTGKTSMVEVLAPEETAFVEIDLEQRDDNLARSLRGKLVAELAELRGLASREAESIRAWVTRRHEEWIPKFKEFATRFPRRFICIGTGNNHEFLDDPTGERRWLPLSVGTVDVAAIREVRDQLWAEGIALFKAGGIRWQDAQRLATDEHASYKVHDSWQDVIAEWLQRDAMDGEGGPKRGDQPFALVDLMVSALGLSVQKITRKDELRAAKALRNLGYEKRDMRKGNKILKLWFCAKNSEEDKHAEFCDLA